MSAREEPTGLACAGAAHDPTGVHLIAELTECTRLLDVPEIERALRDAAAAGRATLVGVHAHGFGDGGGVAAVAVLAESHLSVHTWPEHRYAAIDVFMCGKNAAPDAALDSLVAAFGAARVRRTRLRRSP